MEPRLDTAVLEDPRDFAALEEEWEDLYHDSKHATPFQSWAWLYSWWDSYGEDYELRLVTLRNEKGLLVGLIPLMLERRRGFGRLLFIGTGPTDYLDMLIREGWEDEVLDAGIGALKQLEGWQVADLQQLRPEAAAWGIFRRWGGFRTRVWQDGCPVIDVKPWDELLMSVDRKLRSNARRALRRTEKDGVRREPARPEDAERAARRWIALHREVWRGREILPEHLTQRWATYAETVALRMIARGLGEISEFWRDGEVIGSVFWVLGQDFVGQYHIGATQAARQRYQISSLFIWDGVNIARARNSTCLHMLRGEEPYKLQWTSKVIPNFRVVLARNPVIWSPYAGYHVLRSRAKLYVNSKSAPQWTKTAARRLKKITGL
jgi:CelD/BcsL family acetyltransferase involved in cellulose biosynthesis